MATSLELIIMPLLYALGAILLVITVYVLLIGAPFIPTPQPVVEHMVKVAKLKKGMTVMDPGCGDARMLVTACKMHPEVRGIGYELFFIAYILAKIRTWKFRNRIKIWFRNSDHADLSEVDVMFCYMLYKPLGRNADKYKRELKKGAKIISYAFEIPGWQWDEKIPPVPEKNFAAIFIYKI
ncbi:MAG: N-6 DNA methylase [Candidatus Abawacabacteria bacterium]|nr:N-6 DNA methylase [Candidatus Abawacabacteria bacterium]